ncbi:hypothetical protein EDC01DRAFT_629088 [Geopyxis carbonaria]|nr:hypothetical protein EDC01DRAFT_629088 [Geopyxis carbonaria]
MSAPHRGLPPPAAMIPSPTQGPGSGLGQLPQQWQNSEESMRTWLQTKMEEERRRAEEERTRQEQFRGETRRVELEMMREAFKHNVPPPLVPLIFMGPGVVKTSSGEWVHEYVNQQLGMFQQQAHPGTGGHQIQPGQPPASPSQGPPLRREGRSIHRMHQQPIVAPVPTPPVPQMGPRSSGTTAAPPPPPPPPQQQGYHPSYQIQGTRSGPPQSQPPIQPAQQSLPPPPPGSTRSTLPRINTNELQIQQVQQPPVPPNAPPNIQQMPMGPPPGAQLPPHGPPTSQGPGHNENPPVTQSPSIFFHHWVPPNTQGAGSGGPSSSVQVTASPQRQLDSPFSHHPPQNPLSGSEHTNSPKKRKTTASQSQQPPPPSSQPFSPQPQTLSSPAATPGRSRRGHSRNRSGTTGASGGFEPYQRPMTRQQRSIGGSEPLDGNTGQPPQYHPGTSSAGDNGRGSQSATGTPSHYTSHDQPRQQSAPPPQHSQPPSRPYSAGSDFRRQPYPPPTSQPPPPPAGDDGARK